MSLIGTIADWRTWATARGDSAPADADDADATAALQRATDYIRYYYVSRFVSPYTEASDNVEEATYVAAGVELATPGFFSKTYTEGERKVLTGVDSIRWTVVERGSTARTGTLMMPTHSLIEAMLGNYLPNDNVTAPYIKRIGGRRDS
ncbi:hypothetical protein FF098_014800 [Parvularcula flava]|uniref:Uncharacterized protein n=1 Tax=Aquisalinus luteolus TaxID=1566827 RepID=A0A8J3EPX1_9PROT|nr:hypothetical protein [Aquisalinus luteolus]NHK29187.1 hypothetical protein [Aquisalinus luteolus]GGI00036.1 hypothetical protein GCM10011355_27380 [Aquisalinus luteolus]